MFYQVILSLQVVALYKTNMKRIILCCIGLLLPLLCFAALTGAPELYFYNVTGVNTISQSNVKAICEDSYGFMWFGTKNGLNRYDGYRFREFDVQDTDKHCGNNNVSVLFEDSDKKLWVGTDKGVYRFDPVKEKFVFIDLLAQDSVYMNDWVSAIESDKDGRIWIVIPNQGVFRYDQQAHRLQHYPFRDKSRKPERDESTPQSLCIRANGEVWIGSNRMGLFKYDSEKDSFSQWIVDAYGNTVQGENIYTLCEYGDALVMGVHEGMLKKWDLNANRISVFDTPQIHYKIIRCVKCFDRRNLLVATQDGLYVVNERDKSVHHYFEDDLNPYGLSDNNIFTIYKDREGGIWLGSLFGGVDYLPKRAYTFRKYFPVNIEGSIEGKRIREMCEDSHGNIWIGTEDKGVNVFYPQKHIFRHIDEAQSAMRTNLALMADRDKVYVGIFKAGMEVYSIDTYKARFYSGKELNLLDEASVCALFKDSEGGYWLGNSWGVYYAPGEYLSFKRMSQFGDAYIYDIAEDRNRNIWIATMGNGVMCYNLDTHNIRTYVAQPGDSLSLSSNSVSSVTIGRKGEVWFSTDRGGICRYNRETDDFTTFSVKDGFPDNVCYKILEDWHHNLWFGTNKGLVCFNPETRAVRVYTERDGLLSDQFNYKSALESRDGTFYFGTIKGLIAFNPYKMGVNNHIPPVYITQMRVHNQDVKVGDADSLLSSALQFTQEVVLHYNQENVSFDFVALDYVSPSSNKFRYRLEGVDDNWVSTSQQRVSYSQLSPGKYRFRVQASNNDGKWNYEGASLSVIVLPPWWRTVYAYISYVLLVMLCVYAFFLWYKHRKEMQSQRAVNLLEMRKEKELYSAKVEFFTSIAHEIKTPLSLIKGPLEAVLTLDLPSDAQKWLKVIDVNTERLLSLINQLLDFRKIEGNRMSLSYTMQDIVALLKETLACFEPSITHAGKHLVVSYSVESCVVPIDKEAVTKVLSNLLSNALKYAANVIKVDFVCDENDFSVSVASDGDIIPYDKQRRIFEPFYQIEDSASGVGLGLSLARSIVELHNGYLDLSVSPDGKYNVFTLTLPRKQDGVIVWESKFTNQDSLVAGDEMLARDAFPTDMSGSSVLVVDDNPEVLEFLVDRFSDRFVVFSATNGKEALEILEREIVHIIVCDVMMPVMDGFELCRVVKNTPQYAHIPVILLSAKSDLQSKLHGMELGADAFLEKPFSFTYLIAKVNNLLLNRQKEEEAVVRRPLVHKIGQHTKAEEELMERIAEVIRQNMADESFNVEKLASTLCMSRSDLHRKTKKLFDLPPVEYIRLVRLQHAATLLAEGKYSISEVAAMVGIGSPSYFSRLFQKQFGVTPKVFVMQQRERRS